MSMHDDEAGLLTRSEKTEWHCFLTKFERDVWPTMKEHGFSRDTALVVFELNRVQSLLVTVQQTIEAMNVEEE